MTPYFVAEKNHRGVSVSLYTSETPRGRYHQQWEVVALGVWRRPRCLLLTAWRPRTHEAKVYKLNLHGQQDTPSVAPRGIYPCR